MDVRETPFPVHIKCNTIRKYSEKQCRIMGRFLIIHASYYLPIFSRFFCHEQVENF